jgi:lipid A 3-O-deacylase
MHPLLLWVGRPLLASAIFVVSDPAAFADGLIDEVKVGVLAYDVGFVGPSIDPGAAINGEVLFRSIQWFIDRQNLRWLNDLLAPRPTIGTTINTAGDMNFYYAGLTWNADLFGDVFRPDDGIFADFGFGGAIQDGHVGSEIPGEISFGSRALFHLSGELGYRFDPQISIALYYEHFSNADLAEPNPGVNNIGLRFGYRF